MYIDDDDNNNVTARTHGRENVWLVLAENTATQTQTQLYEGLALAWCFVVRSGHILHVWPPLGE